MYLKNIHYIASHTSKSNFMVLGKGLIILLQDIF